MRPFYYSGRDGAKSFCGLDVLSSGPDSATVIITELPGNPGTPVRDFFENLATLLYRNKIQFLKIVPTQIVWIEHHPGPEGDHAAGDDETYEQVVMHWDGERFHSPVRVSIPHSDWTRYRLE